MEVEILFSATQAITRRLLEERWSQTLAFGWLKREKEKKASGVQEGAALFLLGRPTSFFLLIETEMEKSQLHSKSETKWERAACATGEYWWQITNVSNGWGGKSEGTASSPDGKSVWFQLRHGSLHNCEMRSKISNAYHQSLFTDNICAKKLAKFTFFCTIRPLTILVRMKGNKNALLLAAVMISFWCCCQILGRTDPSTMGKYFRSRPIRFPLPIFYWWCAHVLLVLGPIIRTSKALNSFNGKLLNIDVIFFYSGHTERTLILLSQRLFLW